MSDLADAVFNGQLMGHVISGDALTSSVLAVAAATADLASHLVMNGDHLHGVEQNILEARVAQHTLSDGEYHPGNITGDHMHAQLDSEIVHNVFTESQAG